MEWRPRKKTDIKKMRLEFVNVPVAEKKQRSFIRIISVESVFQRNLKAFAALSMKQDPVFLKHRPLRRAFTNHASCVRFTCARLLTLFIFSLISSFSACSDPGPQMLRGTGLSAHESNLLLTLNAGLFETADDYTDAESVRNTMTLFEHQFHRANDGMSLHIIVDQPLDAVFVMERMSRRYRLGPPPVSIIQSLHAKLEGGQMQPDEDERSRIMKFLSGIHESNPYYIKHEDGTVFLASGLQLYSGGQVHYDLMILSQPLIEDRADAWLCCSLQANMKEYVVLPAPGRSALDGVAVATANNVDQIRVALQRLIGTDSEWRLSPSRRSLLRLYAARNGELKREECKQLVAARLSIQELQGVQRIAVEESFQKIERFCSEK